VDKETAYRILREVNAQHNPDIVYCQHGAYGVLVGRSPRRTVILSWADFQLWKTYSNNMA
jgi:hypothetical protein